MARFLPLIALVAFGSIFGLAWIVTSTDPDNSPWYIFGAFVLLLFTFLFCVLGLLLYLIRTRFYRRYSSNWYFYTSFKMAFFVADFMAIAATLAIADLVSTINIILAILAVSLFALYSYLGKRIKGKG